MRLTPLMYFAQSENGRQGYVMSLEVAKLIAKRKPPPEPREGRSEPPEYLGNTNGHPRIKTRHIGD